MYFPKSSLLVLAVATANAAVTPTINPIYFEGTNSISPSASLTSRLTSAIFSYFQPSHTNTLLEGKHDDWTIYDLITKDEHFTQLAKLVNYSSDSTKDLLKDPEVQLTIFAPVNWHKEHHSRDLNEFVGSKDHFAAASLSNAGAEWKLVEDMIQNHEAEITHEDGEDDERKRRRIAHFVDAVLLYHLVDSKHPIEAKDLINNSTVASRLSIQGKAAEVVGKLNDGLPLRIRVGKSLVPRPGVYLNFYNRVVYPDIHLKNGLVHAVQYPLFQSPSILQGLFWAQPAFGTLSSALQKVDSDGYLALPVPKHHHDDDHKSRDQHHKYPHNGRRGFSDPKGSAAATLFAPGTLAWDRLPLPFLAYLFSPWGADVLAKVLMLHSIPNDVFYADSVHHVSKHGNDGRDEGITTSYHEPALIAKLWGEHEARPQSGVNVTRYTFDSVLPKLPKDGDDHGELPPPGEAKEYEKVDVEVWRYHLFPGGKGPLQTAIRVQGVPVVAADIPHLNGATHAIGRFIKPRGHPHHGVWAEVAREAEAYGFGAVDLEAEARKTGSEAW